MPPIPLPNPPSTSYFPSPSASPEEIRTYIFQVLTTKHGFTPEEAEGVASKWTVMRGADFREIVDWTGIPSKLRELFGTAVASVLGESVTEDWWQSNEGAWAYCMCPYCIALRLLDTAK